MARLKKNTLSPPTQHPVTSLNPWLEAQAGLDSLRFITCGSVDDGKSTLIGRLLWETQQIYDDQLDALAKDSKRHGTQGDAMDLALLVDGLAAEREQGITIDVAHRFFSSPKRKFVAIDTPGHVQYTRNMVTGASNADAAVLLIDARQGVLTQTLRHAYLVSLVKIRQVVLAVNKMDLVGYDPAVFNAIVAQFKAATQSFGFEGVTPIPVSALKGENITARSAHTPWYPGPTLLACLETLNTERPTSQKMVFPVQWVNRPDASFRGYSGTLESGRLSVGDSLRVTASGQTATLEQIVTADGLLSSAQPGDVVTLVLDREIDASRGDVIALAEQPLEMTDQFEATLVWMQDDEGHMGRAYEIKLATQWASASISSIKHRVNVDTQAHEACKHLSLNDIVVVNVSLSKPLVFQPFSESSALGGFILVDKFTHATVAAGMVHHSLRRAQNVQRQALSICRADRERLNGHKGQVIWLTGLSGSGKSTIANALEKELHAKGRRTFILDGDNIRQGLNRDLGFTDADRVENIRRVAEVAKLMMEAGLMVLTAFISPFRAEREMARELIGADNFTEIFVDTPLAVCEQRDPKGLYKKARSGLLPHMTGIDSPYEVPLQAQLVVKGGSLPLNNIVQEILQQLAL